MSSKLAAIKAQLGTIAERIADISKGRDAKAEQLAKLEADFIAGKIDADAFEFGRQSLANTEGILSRLLSRQTELDAELKAASVQADRSASIRRLREHVLATVAKHEEYLKARTKADEAIASIADELASKRTALFAEKKAFSSELRLLTSNGAVSKEIFVELAMDAEDVSLTTAPHIRFESLDWIEAVDLIERLKFRRIEREEERVRRSRAMAAAA